MSSDQSRALSFGAVAEQYDRARPSYPAELIDELLALPHEAVLEVGCGTGKASELLLARGVQLLAVEPDERMAAVARRKGVPVEVSPFESWDAADRTFDLIVAGQSWHWVAQPAGAERALALLRPGGHLAAFWNLGTLDAEVTSVLESVYREVAPLITDTAASLREQVDEHRGQLDALHAAGFAPVELRTYPWTRRYSSHEWVEYIGTHSDHATLPAAQRDELLRRVGAAIDAIGGAVDFHFTTALMLATRP